MKLNYSIKNIIRLLAGITSVLVILNILVDVIKLWFGHNYLMGLVPLFDFYEESNIPSWYSGLLLFAASGLLFIIAQLKAKSEIKKARYWYGLAAIFMFLSMDEIAQIHELSGRILGMFGRGSGVFYNMWVIAAGLGLVIFAVFYFRFWLSLAEKPRKLFLIAGIIYVSGAIGFEMLESWAHDASWVYIAAPFFITMEETMEMSGVILFIYSLLHYIKTMTGEFAISFL